jgi:hypothetical protein
MTTFPTFPTSNCKSDIKQKIFRTFDTLLAKSIPPPWISAISRAVDLKICMHIALDECRSEAQPHPDCTKYKEVIVHVVYLPCRLHNLGSERLYESANPSFCSPILWLSVIKFSLRFINL